MSDGASNLTEAVASAAAWIGAMLERLERGEAPLPGFEEAAVRADRARFDAAPLGRSPQVDLSDSREKWAWPAASAVDGLSGLVTRLHERTRGASWEPELWFWLLPSLPGGAPEAVVHDLIDREIAIHALGHSNLSDAALWRLAGRVDEALLTLAKRRYGSAEYTADQFEEVLHAFPEHEWMLASLPSMEPSEPAKAERLAGYIGRRPVRDWLLWHATREFLEVWERTVGPLEEMLNRFYSAFRESGEEPRYLPDWTIHEHSTAHAVPNVMPWVMHKRGTGRDRCAAHLAELMRELKPEQWGKLYTSFACAEVRPRDVAVLAALARDDAVEMLGVATLNRDGYVREPAVRAMAQLQHPRAIPYLLLRMGDWVEPVRIAASEALRALIVPENAPVFLEHHRLLRRLGDIERVNLSVIRGEIDALLNSPAVRPALMEGLQSPQASVRQFCYRTLAAGGPLEPEVVEAAARDCSPAVRRWIAGRIVRGETAASDELRRVLLRDRAAIVSTTMIRWLGEADMHRFRDDLLELMFAPARSVRTAVRFAMRSEGIDFASLARERIANSGDAVATGVVATLADTGDVSDLAVLRGFLDHPRSAVRAAAMAGVARLDPEGALPIALAKLDDPSGRVRREAIAALRVLPQPLWIRQVQMALATGAEGTQSAALRLLSQLGLWESLAAAMQAAQSKHEAIRQRGQGALLACSKRQGNWAGIEPPTEVRKQLVTLWPQIRDLDSVRQLEGAWNGFFEWAESLKGQQ